MEQINRQAHQHKHILAAGARRTPCDACDSRIPHVRREAARQAIAGEETIERLAELFKTFGDPTRARILIALSQGELRVCCIAQVLDMTQSAISHQLRILRQTHLVRARREGREMFYALDDDHVMTIIGQGLAHVKEMEPK